MANNRIKQSDLEQLVHMLNEKTGHTGEDWENGKTRIGMFTLSYAYGGVSLHRYTNNGGAVNDVFRCGHIPKRELYYRIRSFIDGMGEA